MTNTNTNISAGRQAFIDCARACGSDPIAEEQGILSIDRAFLPPCVVAVLDGGEPTEDYWTFLVSQTEEAQVEHDRAVATGHEWHNG